MVTSICPTSFVCAFEILPIALNGGAKSVCANTEEICYFNAPTKNEFCNDPKYKVGIYTDPHTGRPINTVNSIFQCPASKGYAVNQPIHEAMTRAAYRKVCKNRKWKECALTMQPNSRYISGVIWNDDPNFLLRHAIYGSGRKKVVNYKSIMSDKNYGATLTRRSHYGDLQFLHAVIPSDNNMSPTKQCVTLQKIFSWARNIFEIANGDLKLTTRVKNTTFEEYLVPKAKRYGRSGCRWDKDSKTLGDLFCVKDFMHDKNTSENAGEQTRTFWQLAFGTLLHIIQDSYSSSHVIRDNKTFYIKKFEAYTRQPNHCIADAGTIDNKSNINQAQVKSNELFELYARTVFEPQDKKAKWEDWENFLKSVFAVDGFEKCNLSSSK